MINSNLYPDIFCENNTYTSSFDYAGLHPIIQVYRSIQGRSMLVIGEGSIGKSTAMLILQAQLLYENFPCFLFECKYINQQSIVELQKLSPTQKAVVIIDGLDETKGSIRPALLSEIRRLRDDNIQIVITSRYNPQQYAEDEKTLFAQFVAAELQRFSDKRIREIVGDRVFKNQGYVSLLRNTMYLALHLEFVARGVDEEYSSQIYSESEFLKKYFQLLYRQKEYGDDFETKYLTDLTALGNLLYDRFFDNSGTDNNMQIPKELTHLFYYKDGVLYSSHLKYENFALALYMKRSISDAFARWRNKKSFVKQYIEQMFDIELKVDEYGVERDAAESFYYLGQMLQKLDYSNEIIAAMNQDEFKKPNSLFANLICIYLGYSNDILDDAACNIDVTFKDILPELARFYIMYFSRFIRYLKTSYIYDVEPLKSRMPNLLEICINNDVYKSVNNCLIVKNDNSLDLACINSVIPDDGSVKKILDCAFSRINGLTEIIIPSMVEQLEDSAIYQCEHLKRIEFGKDVWYISATAIIECPQLSELTVVDENPRFYSQGNCVIDFERKTMVLGCKNSIIPDDGSVIEISEDTFAPIEELTELWIPDEVEVVRTEAVTRCLNLQSIYLGRNIKYIETGAVCFCYGLKKISVHPENTYYKSVDNCLIELNTGRVILVANGATIPSDGNARIIAAGAFSCWRGSALDYEEFSIPDNIITIEDSAFTVVHGENAIDDKFYYGGIAYVGNKNNPFMVVVGCHPDCRELSFHRDTKILYKLNGEHDEIIIPDGIISISAGALVETQYSKLFIGKDVNHIGAPLNFFNQQYVDFEISKQNEKYYVRNNCIIEKNTVRLVIGNESGIIPEGTRIIGKYAFANTDVLEISMPNSIIAIEKSAFECCSALEYLTLSDGIKEIPDEAFLACMSIEKIVIPDGVTVIGEAAFIGCADLKYVYLPDSIVSIKIDRYGRIPFADCNRIEEISIPRHLQWLSELLDCECKVIVRN